MSMAVCKQCGVAYLTERGHYCAQMTGQPQPPEQPAVHIMGPFFDGTFHAFAAEQPARPVGDVAERKTQSMSDNASSGAQALHKPAGDSVAPVKAQHPDEAACRQVLRMLDDEDMSHWGYRHDAVIKNAIHAYLVDAEVFEAGRQQGMRGAAVSPCSIPGRCRKMNRRCDVCDPLVATPHAITDALTDEETANLVATVNAKWRALKGGK